ANGAEALTRARAQRPGIVLLDLNLPDMPGEDVCRQLKADTATSGAAVLMLTGKSGETDRITGLELGAEDYISKPFSLRELILRIEAVRRRLDARAATPVGGAIELDDDNSLIRVGSRMVQLTDAELRLLKALLDPLGGTRTRQELEQRAWDDA